MVEEENTIETQEVKQVEETKQDKQETPASSNFAYFMVAAVVGSLFIGGLIGSFAFPQGTGATGALILPTGDSGTCTADGAGVSLEELSVNVTDYLNRNSEALFGGEFDFVVTSNEELSEGFYMLLAEAKDANQNTVGTVPIYTTNDAEQAVIWGNAINLAEDLPLPDLTPPETREIPQTEKPIVEVFVMSHCPYGTQIEKAILPVYETLGDKIDLKIRFVDYVMHGETEIWEQANQYCIQKDQKEKYFEYLSCFLEDGDGEQCLEEVGINTEVMETCVTEADEEFNLAANLADTGSWLSGQFPLFNIDKGLNELYKAQSSDGRWGSPGLVINGVLIEGAPRNPATLLGLIGSAFIELPEETLGANLSSETPSPGFGYEGTGSDAGGCAT